jgi:hypothetical protein
MNNQEKYQEDLLRKYISPERREEAPEGFTSKVMTRIGVDTVPLIETSRKRNLVPYISVLVTVMLIGAAFFIPDSKSDLVTKTVMSLIKGIRLSVPEINLSTFFQLSVPAVITYVFVGILVLTIFDRALYGFFKKEK